MRRVLARVVEVAPTRLPVLLLGEPGVGKEVVAAAIHRVSGRAGPFEAIDMGALSAELAESTLFGHTRGAFTGAAHDREGLFRRARGGTVFLDEIGNLAPSLQAKLLRVLETRTVQPLGDDRTYPIDVRVLAATNADLHAMVDRGDFRADLLTRLAGFSLEVPPLRDRKEDVPRLAAHFLAQEPVQPRWSGDALAQLEAHDWPGNARELRHVVRYAAAVAGDTIAPSHLGALAEHRVGPAPLLTTGTEDEPAALEPRDLRALTMVTLRVPPLRERGAASIRHRVLHGLGGTAIAADALEALARAPWWGNQPELDAAVRALSATRTPLIQLDDVRHLLPNASSTRAPVRVLLAPTFDAHGGVDGLVREYDDQSLLIGRIERMSDLRRASRSGDERLQRWVRAIDRLTTGIDPACLDLSLLQGLSRAQALVLRGADGLWVHALPSSALEVHARGLDSHAPLVHVTPDAPVVLGTGGEIRLQRSGTPQPVAHLFVFLGAVAFDTLGAVAVQRWRASQREADQTEVRGVPPARRAPDPPPRRGGLRVWVLSPGEVDALNSTVATFRGGQFKAHLLSAARGWRRDATLSRLHTFVLAAPRVAQYVARLYELEGNARLREDLLARAEAGTLVVDALPKGIRTTLTP
jgi:DNA-binding NtrC family response regulator